MAGEQPLSFNASEAVEPGCLLPTTARHRSHVGDTDIVGEGATCAVSRDATVKIQNLRATRVGLRRANTTI